MFELTPLFQNGAAASELAFRLPDFSAIVASPLALGGILYTGLITSHAFAKVPATNASIILTTEPSIAAGFGALTLGESVRVGQSLHESKHGNKSGAKELDIQGFPAITMLISKIKVRICRSRFSFSRGCLFRSLNILCTVKEILSCIL